MRRYLHPQFYCSIIQIAEIVNKSVCPSVDEWIKIHIHAQTHAHPCTYITEYNSVMRKNEILSFMTICMKLEDIILSEINGVRKILHGGGTKMEA